MTLQFSFASREFSATKAICIENRRSILTRLAAFQAQQGTQCLNDLSVSLMSATESGPQATSGLKQN